MFLQFLSLQKQSSSCLAWCLAGVITTATAFDRERQRQFTLSVTATDQADQPLVGICTLTVQVADQNDNKPRFENSRYQCEYCHPDCGLPSSFQKSLVVCTFRLLQNNA